MTRGASRIARWLSFGFLCLYAITAQRGVSWQDSGVFQLRIAYCNLSGFFGAATDHSLYIRLAHAFSSFSEDIFGLEVPASANLFSALCAALAVKVLFTVAFEVTGSRRGAFLAAITFGFAHMVWWLATIAETYTLSTLFIGLEVLYMIRIMKGNASFWSIMKLAAFSGLGFATHNLSLLSLPFSIAVVIAATTPARDSAEAGSLRFRATRAIWQILSGGVWFVCSGLSRKIYYAGDATPWQIASNILFGNYAGEVVGVSGASIKVTVANFAIMAFSLLLPCWLVAARAMVLHVRSCGLRAAISGTSAQLRIIAALLAVHAVFLLHYRIADQALFMLPTLFFASILLAALLKNVRIPALLAVATVVCGVAMPLAANAVLHLPPFQNRIVASRSRILPFRDEVRYWALPWKHDESSAERFAAAAIAAMDAKGDASLFADSTSAPPLSLRLEDASPSWHLYTPWNDCSRFTAEAVEGRQTFAVSPVPGYCPNAALATGNVKPLFQ